MSKVEFQKIFKGNFLKYVTDYKDRIQTILNDYDIIIFMARKAICFYESMIINGELIKTNCEVFSSRIIDYNIISKIKNKKVAIVDDVVVKGTSLNRVISVFRQEGIDAYVLVVACEASLPATIITDNGFELCDSYVTLELGDIYSFAGMITEYIEASMCPFNIDQPIYRILNMNKDSQKKLFMNYNAVNISSGLQESYGIDNRVIFFRNVNSPNAQAFLNMLPKNTILKMRIMSSESSITAIPFVLFPHLNVAELDTLYSVVSCDFLDDFVSVNNELITQENKMKVISYFYSEVLAIAFFSFEKIIYEQSIDNDILHYSIDSSVLFSSTVPKLNPTNEALCLDKEAVLSYSKFAFNYTVAICYKTIICMQQNREFSDSNNKLIDETIISHNTFCREIEKSFEYPEMLASIVIDVFIDRGMMVPTIAHFNSGIIRAYKLGEYSKLNRNQIELFAVMLYHYQEMIGRELGKTELEKLCVLFFNSAINRGVFPQQAKYEDDCYSICYSLFGPRVSQSNTIYNANTDSVIVTDFCKKKDGKSIVICRNGKYIINPINTSSRLSSFVLGVAHPYAAVSKMFNCAQTEDSQETKWNMYVHTYVQYLTLRAIGNNKKNQYLSLCAELYQLCKLKDVFFDLGNKEMKEYELILKGINSGLWKYWCFINKALDKTSMLIYKKNHDVGAWLLSDVEPAYDESDSWSKHIYNVAHILYQAAFLINEVFRVKKSLKFFNTNDGVCDKNTDEFSKKTMFTIGSYYAEFKETRHKYEAEINYYEQTNPIGLNQYANEKLMRLKLEAMHQLDLCDLLLENSTAKYASIKKLLVVYSANSDFPINISDGLNELYFEGIECNKNCRVFGFADKKTNLTDFTELLDRINSQTNNYYLKYFVLDVGEKNEIAHIKSTVKDYRIAEILNCILDGFIQRKAFTEPELVLISENPYNNSFDYNNHSFNLSNDYAKIIEEKLSILSNRYLDIHLSVNIFVIGKNTLNIEGENKMRIDKVEHSTIVEQNGDNPINTTFYVNIANVPEGMLDLLQQTIKQIDSTDRKKMEKAIEYAEKNDTNKFVKVMKTIGKHSLSIIENIASNVLSEWLHQNGIL